MLIWASHGKKYRNKFIFPYNLLWRVLGGATVPHRRPGACCQYHGELYIATQYEKGKDVISGTAPHIELNYGIVPNVMLHLIAPYDFNKPDGASTQHGYGDTEIGVKYRFINDEDTHFMVGAFPLVELPTGDSDKPLGAGHTLYFIPLWFQKSWGPWQSYGGGGFWRNPGSGNKDYWFFGWHVQRDISKTLVLGVELFSQTKTTEDGKNQTGFTLGAIMNLTDDHHLLFSSGRDIQGENRFSAYLAYQYTFGSHKEE
ncbi:MAG TPA: transporter [Nitrospirota bacterium]|nr:transporter [Nitrospirota bacterium]